MVLCVTMTFTTKRLLLPALNLDFPHMVCLDSFNDGKGYELFVCIGALVLPTGSFDVGLPIAVSDIACEGSEKFLLNCSVSEPPGVCESGEGAAVVCQGEICVHDP